MFPYNMDKVHESQFNSRTTHRSLAFKILFIDQKPQHPLKKVRYTNSLDPGLIRSAYTAGDSDVMLASSEKEQ